MRTFTLSASGFAEFLVDFAITVIVLLVAHFVSLPSEGVAFLQFAIYAIRYCMFAVAQAASCVAKGIVYQTVAIIVQAITTLIRRTLKGIAILTSAAHAISYRVQTFPLATCRFP
jgi:hypothetical protein